MGNILDDPYRKRCEKCKEIRLIPNGHTNCLKCMIKDGGLRFGESFCLQCGKKISKPKKFNFCWDCTFANSDKFKEKFIAALSKEQLILFREYEGWRDARTSLIILD